RKLQGRLEALFHRLALVFDHRFQRRPLRSMLLDELRALDLAVHHGFLCHISFLRDQLLKGMLKCFNSAFASASVRAVVQMMMSMPRTSSTLSKSISGNTMCSFRPIA